MSIQEQAAARELDAAKARLDRASAAFCAAKSRTIDDRVMCLVDLRLNIPREEPAERALHRDGHRRQEETSVARLVCERAGARTICRFRSQLAAELGGG
jgi:hypothetical protein